MFRERWLIDYDNTLCDTQSPRLKAVNKKFGTNYQAEDMTTWLTQEIMPAEHAEFMFGPQCFLSEKFQAKCRPIVGAIDGLKILMSEYNIEPMIVSDRPSSLFEVTRDWLDREGLDTTRLLFTRHKHSLSTGTKGMTKVQAVYNHRLSVVVEDAPHHALRMALLPYVKRVFLLDMPYNQNVEHEKIHRVVGWDDILRWKKDNWNIV